MIEEIELQDLIISKQLRMNINNYKSAHVAAAIQLGNNERVSRGDNIEYVYTDSQHQNPLPNNGLIIDVEFTILKKRKTP
jgi:DNA polymerase elongation subunit (family B)